MSRRSGSLKPLRSFLKTSLPAAIDLASQTIMWTIEAILIGKLGGAALAGHSMAIQIVLVFFAVLITFVVGAGLIINRYIGARDLKSANHILGQALMLAVIMAALFSIIWHFGGVQLLRLIRENGSDSAQAAGMSYLRMVSFFGPLIMTNFVAVGIIRAVGETRFSMRINLTTNVVNLLLAPIFIFGLFGAPRLEVRGAALAVGCAHTLGFFLTFRLLRSGRTGLRLDYHELTSPKWDSFRELFRKGLPTTVEQLAWSLGQLVVISYAGMYSVAVLGTHAIFMRLQNVLSMIYMGFSLAAMSNMGQNLGAANHEQALKGAKTSHRAALLFVGVIILMLILFAKQFIHVFTVDSQIVQLGRRAIVIFALAQLPKAVNNVVCGNLRGVGELKWLMLNTIAFVLFFEVGLNYVAVFLLAGGIYGIWTVQALDETLRLILNVKRLYNGDWRRLVY